jgi:mannan endo-1,4-beta-mannosidase
LNSNSKSFFCLLIIIFIYALQIFPQQGFVTIKNSKFYFGGKEFRFLGFNAYYLQSIYYDTTERHFIDNVFQMAKDYGFKVIRIWAFNDGDSENVRGVIRYSPYGYAQEGFKALDYVLLKANEDNIKLILSLENNQKDFGGIPQYLRWADKYLGSSVNYTKNDFFTNDSIKAWYKNYICTLLNHRNYFTNISLKDDPAIFGFELINEAENPGENPQVILNWYDEMSFYFKSIDSSHLLSTGEIGYDISTDYYSNVDLFYNSSYFLFDGYKGTSFFDNTGLKNIDYASFHLYTEAWKMNKIAGNTWINDHVDISASFGKPALLGEFGTTNEKEKFYREYLEMIRNSGSNAAVVWQYVPLGLNINDGYQFNEVDDPQLLAVFENFISNIYFDSTYKLPQGVSGFYLYQNYPNPFNPTTTIKYIISKPQFIEIDLYNSIGERIGILEKAFKEPGEYQLDLSFNNGLLGSAVYFYQIIGEKSTEVKKMILLK